MDTDEGNSTLKLADVENLKVTELKAALRERNLDDKGLKSNLQARLVEFLTKKTEAANVTTTETPGPPTDADATPTQAEEEEIGSEAPEEEEVFSGKIRTFRINKSAKVEPDESFKRFGHKGETIEISASDILTDMSPAILKEGQLVEFKLRKDEHGIYGTELTAAGGEPVPEGEGGDDTKKEKFPRTEACEGKSFTGKIVKFMHWQGTGFISFDDLESFDIPTTLKPKQKQRFDKTKELWFHRGDIVSTDPAVGIAEGTEVQFVVYTDERGMGGREIKLKSGQPVSGFKYPLRRGEVKRKKNKRKREAATDGNPAAAKKVRLKQNADGSMELVSDDDSDEPDKKKRKENWDATPHNGKTGALRGRVMKYDATSKRGVIEAMDNQYVVFAWQIHKDASAGVTDESVRLNTQQRVEFFPGKNSDGENIALYVCSKTGGPVRTQQNRRQGGGRMDSRGGGRRRQSPPRATARRYQSMRQNMRQPVQYVQMPMGGQAMSMGGMQYQPMSMGGQQVVYTTVPGMQQSAMPRQGNFTYVAASQVRGQGSQSSQFRTRRQGGGRQGRF